MNERKIEVIGWDNGFSGPAREILEHAQLVIAAPRLLTLRPLTMARRRRSGSV